jgi:putative ABC transport system substrate-binding protein
LASAAYRVKAQSTKTPKVAVLVTHAAVNDPVFDSLRSGLRDFGYEEGRNFKLDFVTARGHMERLPELAAEIVRSNVDVIICPNEASTRAALQATGTIPIVMVGFGYDPVAVGLVDSFGRPGRNVTGIYTLPSELEGKRLEVLKEVLPSAARVAVFWQDPFGVAAVNELKRAARSLGVRLELVELRGSEDLDQAFKTAKRSSVSAVMLPWSPIVYVHRAQIAALALESKLPTLSAINQSVEAGALISYGTEGMDSFRRAAYYVDRLLKGAKPQDLPVEQVSKLKLAVNLKTARALGINIPDSILLRADEILR